MNSSLRRYRQLDPARIIETAERLRQRISERFPSSGLAQIGIELEQITREAAHRSSIIRRPNTPLRLAIVVVVGLLAVIVFLFIRGINANTVEKHLSDALDVAQFAESALGTIVFLGAFLLFLVSLEIRFKRKRALDAIYELRSLAHVVDMHQLTKDPEIMTGRGPATKSSPERKMTPFELGRYLDYCAEILSLIGKVSVVYLQGIQDAEVLESVDQIETLTTSLSRKIFQKITLLDRIQNRLPPSTDSDPTPQ
ncbi:hypothetical protein K2X85_14930 [bacterium]|nr:hypothetical protein [bacterium]